MKGKRAGLITLLIGFFSALCIGLAIDFVTVTSYEPLWFVLTVAIGSAVGVYSPFALLSYAWYGEDDTVSNFMFSQSVVPEHVRSWQPDPEGKCYDELDIWNDVKEREGLREEET